MAVNQATDMELEAWPDGKLRGQAGRHVWNRAGGSWEPPCITMLRSGCLFQASCSITPGAACCAAKHVELCQPSHLRRPCHLKAGSLT